MSICSLLKFHYEFSVIFVMKYFWKQKIRNVKNEFDVVMLWFIDRYRIIIGKQNFLKTIKYIQKEYVLLCWFSSWFPSSFSIDGRFFFSWFIRFEFFSDWWQFFLALRDIKINDDMTIWKWLFFHFVIVKCLSLLERVILNLVDEKKRRWFLKDLKNLKWIF